MVGIETLTKEEVAALIQEVEAKCNQGQCECEEPLGRALATIEALTKALEQAVKLASIELLPGGDIASWSECRGQSVFPELATYLTPPTSTDSYEGEKK